MPERGSSIINAMRICFLAVVIAPATDVLASAFHYCLQKVFYLDGEVAAESLGSSMNAVLVAALLGAVKTAASSRHNNHSNEGVLSGLFARNQWIGLAPHGKTLGLLYSLTGVTV